MNWYRYPEHKPKEDEIYLVISKELIPPNLISEYSIEPFDIECWEYIEVTHWCEIVPPGDDE